MKRQVELKELVEELQKENLQKRDFVLPSKCISMVDGKIIVTNTSKTNGLKSILEECGIAHSVEIGGEITTTTMELTCLDVMHHHLQDKLSIPAKYYNRMLGSHNSLLDENVSYWLRKNNTNHLLRCFIDKEEKKGFARALLSDRFKVIDNYDILLTALTAIKESGMNIQIDTTDEKGQTGCDLTERGMYLRFVCPDIEIKSPELLKAYRPNGEPNNAGDGIISGFVIRNSEVGLGSLSISPRAKILACKNGLITSKENFSKTHLGVRMDEYQTIQWSEETKQRNLELIVAQIRDAIKTYTSEEYLGARLSEITAKNKQLEYPLDTIKAVTNKLIMSDDKASDIINMFIKSGDMTSFGVTQAITLFAHTKSSDADEQYSLEMDALDVFNNIEEYDKPLPKKSVGTQLKLN